MISTEIEKLRKKLREAKTLEEKKLLQDVLLSYTSFLREKLGRLESEVRGHLHALYITVPLTFATLVITALAYIREQELLLLALRLIVTILATIVVVLTLRTCTKNRRRQMLEREILEIYNVLLDPDMRPERDIEVEIIAIVLAVLALVAVVLAWTMF